MTMAIFLDYHREDRKITHLTVMESNQLAYDFTADRLDECIEYLMLPGHIVTFQRPLLYLMRELEIYPVMEDIPVRRKWLDFYTLLFKESEGKGPSLEKLARATLGEVPRITRLNKFDANETLIIQKMHDRLDLLKMIYDYGVQHGQLSYYYLSDVITVEVELLESA